MYTLVLPFHLQCSGREISVIPVRKIEWQFSLKYKVRHKSFRLGSWFHSAVGRSGLSLQEKKADFGLISMNVQKTRLYTFKKSPTWRVLNMLKRYAINTVSSFTTKTPTIQVKPRRQESNAQPLDQYLLTKNKRFFSLPITCLISSPSLSPMN